MPASQFDETSMKNSEHPISGWIAQMHAGDYGVADQLFGAYFDKLLAFARARLHNLPCRAEDEEDVVQSALKSYVRGAAAGRFDRVRDRHDLWHLLAKITARKVVARYRRFHAQKRPHPLDEAALAAHGGADDIYGLEHILGREPSPEVAAEFTDDLRSRLEQLPDGEFRQLVLLKLEGFTNAEIAKQFATYERKIERRLEIIRSLWTNHESTSASPANPVV